MLEQLREFVLQCGLLQLQRASRCREDPQSPGTAGILPASHSHAREDSGDLRDGRLQPQRVRGIEGGVEVGDPVRRLVDDDAALVQSSLTSLFGLLDGQVREDESGDELFHGPVGHAADGAGQLQVDQPRGVGIDVAGRAGDLTRLPHGNLKVEHQLPQVRQAMPQVERVPDEHRCGDVTDTQGGGQFDDAELGHLGCSVPTEAPQSLLPRQGVCGFIDHGVEVCEVGSEDHLLNVKGSALGLEGPHRLDCSESTRRQFTEGDSCGPRRV